jgi:hypothetical protein
VTAAQEAHSRAPSPAWTSPKLPQENTALEPTGPERTSAETTAAEETTPTDVEPPEAAKSGEPVGKDKGSDKAGKGGQPESAYRAGDEGGRRKVTVCHMGEKTLTVGAPAEHAHPRHGDGRGACGVADEEGRKGDTGNPGGIRKGPPEGVVGPGGQGPQGHGPG